MNSEHIALVEQNLGYIFLNKELLIRALTTKAFALEEKHKKYRKCDDQEVYCILGDAILKAILVELLMERGYNSRGTITQKKSELENRVNLGNFLQELGLASSIRFGVGEKKQNNDRNPSILGETLEALIAAVYLDKKSYEATKDLISDLFSSQLN